MLRNSKNDSFWKDLEQLVKTLTKVSISNDYFVVFKCLEAILVPYITSIISTVYKRILEQNFVGKSVVINSLCTTSHINFRCGINEAVQGGSREARE